MELLLYDGASLCPSLVYLVITCISETKDQKVLVHTWLRNAGNALAPLGCLMLLVL